jgi:hypothetical protein
MEFRAAAEVPGTQIFLRDVRWLESHASDPAFPVAGEYQPPTGSVRTVRV